MTVEYKIFYDNECATEEQLEQIEEIVVEQQVDVVWEARIKFPVCISEEGTWEGEEDSTRSEFSRVRIEVSVDGGDFIPLIDGRIIGQDAERSSIPGKSMITAIVHDDSALLHQETQVAIHEVETDSGIARAIFDEANLGGEPQIEDTPASPDTDVPILQDDTKMQILRKLASRYGNFHAYVLPGGNPGESIGCFKTFPTEPDDSLPTLYMFGEDRNLAEFNVRQNSNAASRVVGAALSLRDKSVTTATSSYRDGNLLGDEVSTQAEGENERSRRVAPGHSDRVDLESATSGEAENSGYTLDADGSVLPLCFKGVLSPYKVIPVRISDSLFSTNYLISKVVHTLTRSNYTQTFNMKGNAVSASSASCGNNPQASASAALGFNVQVNIF